MIDETSGNRYYYHYDGLGSVAALSKYNTSLGRSEIVEAYCYDAFGQVKINTSAGTDNNWLTPDGTLVSVSAIGNRFMFTGREYDAETGLYCYLARMYSPLLGRFCQPDPAGYIDTMNLYAYCGNNPVNWIDPWGLCGEAAEQEKQKIIGDFNRWCNDPTNPSNGFLGEPGSDGSLRPGVGPSNFYQQCGTHADTNQKWFDRQQYKYWEANMVWSWKWLGFANHTVLLISPKDRELRDNSYKFVLDSWLWNTALSYEEFKKKWPGGVNIPLWLLIELGLF